MMEVFAVINNRRFPKEDIIILFILIGESVFYLIAPRNHLKKFTKRVLLKTLNINDMSPLYYLERDELVEMIKQEGDLLYSYDI